MEKKILLSALLKVGLSVIHSVILALPTMFVWNNVMPALIEGAKTMDYLQAFQITLLVIILCNVKTEFSSKDNDKEDTI